MNEFFIRVNGRGNAWPVYLGQENQFYNANEASDLANASYSVICRESKSKEIKNELLIDAGHGTIQFLIQNNNRLPNALVFTHSHIDHTLSVDWIAQSYFKLKNERLPVYAGKICWNNILKSFPQLKKTVLFKELKPGIPQIINEFDELWITLYPVFHAESAPGAGMILIKDKKSKTKALFTGDVLCPLLRNIDLQEISNCDVIYTDTNNRFAYPNSNHWSFSMDAEGKEENQFFDAWYNEKGKNFAWLVRQNLTQAFDAEIYSYFNDFLNEQLKNPSLYFTISDFVKRINPKLVNLMHYSGSEDKRHSNQEILNENELEKWANEKAKELNLSSSFRVPKVGEEYKWIEQSEL
jgi:glyoxylase-like metal-dependent hydrolase (beta-lactamase superfamily II)